MKEIKIGIVGCGLLGNTHMMALNTIIEEGYFANKADIQDLPMCDIDTDHFTKHAVENNVPNTFTDYHDLIACPDVNTVFIVTPHVSCRDLLCSRRSA